MDFQLPQLCFYVLPLFLFLCANIVTKMLIAKRSNTSRPLPEPWRLPVIGHLHHLLGDFPHRRLRDLATKYGPLMHVKVGEVSTLMVSSSSMAREILQNNDRNFANRPFMVSANMFTYGGRDIAFAPYGTYWRDMRKTLVVELFSASRLRSFKKLMEDEVEDMLISIRYLSRSNGGLRPVNLTELMRTLSMNILSRAALGERFKHQEKFFEDFKEGSALAAGFCGVDMFPSLDSVFRLAGLKRRMRKVHASVDCMLEEIVEEHKSKRGYGHDNFLDVLLKIQQEDKLGYSLPKKSINAILLDLFAGGVDTSTTVIEWVMSELMRNPKIMAKAQAEVRKLHSNRPILDQASISQLEYLKLIVKETFRLHPPSPLLLPRENQECCMIGEYVIPKKTKVVVSTWAIGRDPKLWNEPEKFDPERFRGSCVDFKGQQFELIPFGAGRRACPGISFGMTTVELALANLLYHFDWKMPDGEVELNMDESFGGIVARRIPLRLVPVEYYSILESNQ